MNRPKQRKRDTRVKKTQQGASHVPGMVIINGKPPIYDRAAKVFPLEGHEIFCWGNKIYNPAGDYISPELMAHERVHCLQQGNDIDGWWENYFEDKSFRLEQEMEAHKVEYRTFCLRHKDRNSRAAYLLAISQRLASPMYGKLLTVQQAAMRIKQR
jgi:hypothetical protein